MLGSLFSRASSDLNHILWGDGRDRINTMNNKFLQVDNGNGRVGLLAIDHIVAVDFTDQYMVVMEESGKSFRKAMPRDTNGVPISRLIITMDIVYDNGPETHDFVQEEADRLWEILKWYDHKVGDGGSRI